MTSPSTLESVPKPQARLRPTLDQVYIIAALMLIALRPLLTPIPPHDFWWHVATGRVILETGTIPQNDLFSYTRAGEPFFNQGWLAQLLMALIHRIGGLPLIIVVRRWCWRWHMGCCSVSASCAPIESGRAWRSCCW